MRHFTGRALTALALLLTADGASAANFYCSDTGIFLSCNNIADVKQYCCPNGTYTSCQGGYSQSAVTLINAVNCVKPPAKPRYFGKPIDRGLVPLYLTQAATYILSYHTPIYPEGTPCGNDSFSYTWDGKLRPPMYNPPHCPTPSSAGPFFLVKEYFQGCYTEGTTNPVYNPPPPKPVPEGSTLWTEADSWDPSPAAIAAAQAPCNGASAAATGVTNTTGLPECGKDGNDWESRGTRYCVDGHERQKICDCRPVLYNDPKVWILNYPGDENCFSHWTGRTCTMPGTKPAAADPEPPPTDPGGGD